ncbi:MAG: anthranilate phosphoribosyltransferase [Pelagibacterales bacterium]|nr:anthranilate phosphoribosyltransferase [Pelagibacterales bacterium]OUU61295.1 MAG: anthranilate phosphoribosyltransferase [Alphaproteobacteria bacterium TMED62]|tara:strand:+ start:10340 stop:11353 length:1014 start_codon:yes stop_codon:yes gene_type:complete
MTFNYYFQKIFNNKNLTKDEAIHAFDMIVSGKVSNIEISSFLVALSLKGINHNELISAVKVLRSKCLKIKTTQVVVDTCGTGGDKKNTLNISTATAILASACGITIAKHGNKSVSSKSGSSDVLQELGVDINASFKKVENCLKNIQLCFLMAPLYHNAMKNVAEVRTKIKIPTIFNLLGPLLNPASANIQLIGVYSYDWMMPIAKCLKELKIKKAWVVHGKDGLDEITTTNKTDVIEVNKSKIRRFQIDPVKLKLKKAKLSFLKGKNAAYNAKQILNIFSGNYKNVYYKEIVLLNTAAVLVLSNKCKNLKHGIQIAERNLINGNALKKLNLLRKFTN